ncbi:M23 family metallopeptidase [Patescibacteria group bacterium]|nr:M23 family metallopeptidase [Patescibacteria group bacterium]
MKRHFQSRGHLWKKVAIVAFLLTQATSFFLYGNGFSRSYPLKEVAKSSECRKMKWNELSDDCKQPLPIIHGANYGAYKDNPAYTSIYTTMWGAPYDNGWAVGQGAHQGVDIVSSEGTPVYSVEDGLIVKARAHPGYGNVIMIKHTMENGKVVFSIYGHLKHIYALENTTIKEGDLIGTVGNEGYSFGNHLLWDINITPTNTFAFRGCPEYGNGSFNAIANVVNNGLCRDYLLQRTVDPITWVETQGGTLAL